MWIAELSNRRVTVIFSAKPPPPPPSSRSLPSAALLTLHVPVLLQTKQYLISEMLVLHLQRIPAHNVQKPADFDDYNLLSPSA